MSGHNKWSKIKHKKGATDAKKSKVFSKHARMIAIESKRAHGDKNAPGLRAAIERARADSMPNDNIDRAVHKGVGSESEALEERLYETYGPGGVALLLSILTNNNNRTSQEIRHLLSTLGSELAPPGSAAWAFRKTADGYTPITPTFLSDADGESLASFIEALEEHDDVQDVYTTADDTPS